MPWDMVGQTISHYRVLSRVGEGELVRRSHAFARWRSP